MPKTEHIIVGRMPKTEHIIVGSVPKTEHIIVGRMPKAEHIIVGSVLKADIIVYSLSKGYIIFNIFIHLPNSLKLITGSWLWENTI